ncbi:WecB/TagA/CpsF family glycosyltransferase [Methylocystis sp. MJC1]|uniref:WecB/TagA/CpsF family glycosyltransferase n=1 Tax=Methylocystis sp. MJC1 TaxID=2654282 RepID=UPI001FED750F|nr:WecB/TagA/CpsF family glycosyltransferase [Methylocystis sp. MJC1]KAF2991034.1 putative N-acetylmannosaminyltransferase [Methylocystis sp. MJC1]UZX12510.1 WecB/TagA/CpsF family glycosyltransferase [Methylocystis sp. MJC1]
MSIENIDATVVGGCSVACLGLKETARLMLDLARAPARKEGPYYLTSVNGEVIARRFFDRKFAKSIDCADSIAADGQPLVVASKLFSKKKPLPERVATTDLYPLVARMAQDAGASFYLLGASEEVNRAAYEATKRMVPRLNIVGRSHGFLKGAALEEKLDEINALAPDILWLAMGVPLEQQFVRDHARRLKNVKMIKTSGGLFDFVAGAKKRAPTWMQLIGLEWAFRLMLEPRRLLKRYLTTNPIAAYLLLTQTH